MTSAATSPRRAHGRAAGWGPAPAPTPRAAARGAAAEPVAVGGGHRRGRPSIPGVTEVDERRIYYYLIWPSTFLSIHPDYLLIHRLEPAGAGPTRGVRQRAVR